MKSIVFRAALLAAMAVAPFAPVRAAVLIDAGPASIVQFFGPGNYAVGTEFSVQSNITIDGLGYIDIGSDGLAENHRVGIWDSLQGLLAEATVTNSSAIVASASSLGRWYVQAITPIVLTPGTYRVAGLAGREADALSNDKVGNGVSLSSGYVRTDFPNGGFGFPGLTFPSQAIRATVTSNQFTQNVPEPGTLGLLLAPLCWIGFRALKRKQ